MPALEDLWLPDLPDKGSVSEEVWAAFWAWAAAHPPLQRVCLDFDPSPAVEHDAPALLQACLRLGRARPSLSLFNRADCPCPYYGRFSAQPN